MANAQDIRNRWPISIALMVATFMQSLDITIANVALPHMMGAVSASADQITWVLTSYIVGSAVMTPLSSKVAELIGRKRALMLSLTVFMAASMLCGIASSLPEIVCYRFLQGLAGAYLIPLSQAQLFDMNPPAKHAQAMAIWSSAALTGPALGPMAGGFLTDHMSWRWCFYINLPVGLAALLGIWIFMANDRGGAQRRRFDLLGYASLAIFVTSFQLMLDRGPTLDWFSSREILVEAVTAAISLWIFIAHSITAEHPFFDLSVLRDFNFLPATGFAALVNAVLFGILALLPGLTQTLLGYSVLGAGLLMAPRGIASLLTMFFVPWVMRTAGPRMTLLFGLALVGIATWQMTRFDLSMSSGPLIWSGVIQGIGMGFLFVPLTTLAFGTLPAHLRPEGSSMFALVRSLGGSFGIALMQGQVAVNSQSMHAALAARIDPADPVIAQGFPGPLDPATAFGATALSAEFWRQATMVAYLDVFRVMTVAMLVCAPLTLLLRKPRAAPDPAETAAAD